MGRPRSGDGSDETPICVKNGSAALAPSPRLGIPGSRTRLRIRQELARELAVAAYSRAARAALGMKSTVERTLSVRPSTRTPRRAVLRLKRGEVMPTIALEAPPAPSQLSIAGPSGPVRVS